MEPGHKALMIVILSIAALMSAAGIGLGVYFMLGTNSGDSGSANTTTATTTATTTVSTTVEASASSPTTLSSTSETTPGSASTTTTTTSTTTPAITTEVDVCSSNPCLNSGTCMPDSNGYTCDCDDGYTGQHCDTDIDDCASHLCVNGDCVDGVNLYTCNCTVGQRGTYCDETSVAVTAWLESTVSAYSSGDPIIFTGVSINDGNHYDPSTGQLLCPVDGVYYISLTLVNDGTSSSRIYVFKATDNVLATYSSGTDNPDNTVTNSILVHCAQGEVIKVEAGTSGSTYGNAASIRSTFTVVLIQEQGSVGASDSLIGYSHWLGASDTYTADESVVFGSSRYEERNPGTNNFECPVDGIYFISVTVRMSPNQPIYLSVVKDNQAVLYVEDVNGVDNYGNTISNTGLTECLTGEVIEIKSTTSGGQVFGNAGLPISTFTVMVVHEGTASSFTGACRFKTAQQAYVAGETITFDGVLVDDGSSYSPSASEFVCQTEGIYYIAVTAKKYDTSDLDVEVMHELAPILHLQDTHAENPDNLISISALLNCAAGDSVHVQGSGSGGIGAQTTFTAFLLYQ